MRSAVIKAPGCHNIDILGTFGTMNINAVYRISWTWNRPDNILECDFAQHHVHILELLTKMFPDCHLIFQLERGLTTARLHYQGHIKLKVKERPATFASKCKEFMPGSLHCSPSSRAGSTQAEFYCMKKDLTTVDGPWHDSAYIIPDFSNIKEPAGWMIPIKNILLGPMEDRTIYWIWEEEGCTGKSHFATYMEVHHKIIGLGLATAVDNFYAVSELPARGYIFDVPRTLPRRFDWAEVYMSIEKIKDRNFLSTKYKPKKVLLPVVPHVVVFSNYPPSWRALSLDRWTVFKICQGILIEQTMQDA